MVVDMTGSAVGRAVGRVVGIAAVLYSLDMVTFQPTAALAYHTEIPVTPEND